MTDKIWKMVFIGRTDMDVQGVYLRQIIKEIADSEKMGIMGQVKNLKNGKRNTQHYKIRANREKHMCINKIFSKLSYVICYLVLANIALAGSLDTLTVIPFKIIGDTDNKDIYEFGLPEAIANDLACVPGFTIIERMKLSTIIEELKLNQQMKQLLKDLDIDTK